MARGEHIYVERPQGYSHHGIDLGDGTVIHFSGEPGGSKINACVCRAQLDVFAGGGQVMVQRYGICATPDEVVARAESRLGARGYNLVFNNCEHFTRWCVTGRHSSAQVNGAFAAGGVGATAVTAAHGGGRVIAAIGLAPGVNAPGVMSGLARIGAIIGGGAVAGLVVVGAVPGLVSAGIMNVALADDPALLDEVRSARRVGRWAAVGGGAAGSIAGVAAVHAMGLTGFSGAGISSGLTAVGALTGGGMLNGVLTVAVVPVALAALLAYAAYKIAMHHQARRRELPPASPAPEPA